MTFLRYLALGIATVGFAYSLYINSKEPAATATSSLNCTELTRKKEYLEKLVEDAQPEKCWMGATLGSVVCDSDTNVRHYQSHVEELAEFNQTYTSSCGASGNF